MPIIVSFIELKISTSILDKSSVSNGSLFTLNNEYVPSTSSITGFLKCNFHSSLNKARSSNTIFAPTKSLFGAIRLPVIKLCHLSVPSKAI